MPRTFIENAGRKAQPSAPRSMSRSPPNRGSPALVTYRPVCCLLHPSYEVSSSAALGTAPKGRSLESAGRSVASGWEPAVDGLLVYEAQVSDGACARPMLLRIFGV